MKAMTISLLILLGYCLVGCVIIPKEEVFFAAIPEHISEDDAILAVYQAALKRAWQVKDIDNGKLEIELEHRGYHSILSFTVQERDILYTDRTYFNNPQHGTVRSPAPSNWIKYLKNDVNVKFRTLMVEDRGNSAPSLEPISQKLIGLKSLLDQSLITEDEYKKKREEIIAEY